MSVLIAAAGCINEPVTERCSAEHGVCPQLARLTASVANIQGDPSFTVRMVPAMTDSTRWRADIRVRNSTPDTITITPRLRRCDSYMAIGFWDNEALVGAPVLTFPPRRTSPTDICTLPLNGPMKLAPGVELFSAEFSGLNVTDATLRRVTAQDRVWAALIVREDRRSIVVTSGPAALQ
jgi:hypothetical protein